MGRGGYIFYTSRLASNFKQVARKCPFMMKKWDEGCYSTSLAPGVLCHGRMHTAQLRSYKLNWTGEQPSQGVQVGLPADQESGKHTVRTHTRQDCSDFPMDTPGSCQVGYARNCETLKYC